MGDGRGGESPKEGGRAGSRGAGREQSLDKAEGRKAAVSYLPKRLEVTDFRLPFFFFF